MSERHHPSVAALVAALVLAFAAGVAWSHDRGMSMLVVGLAIGLVADGYRLRD